MNALYTVIENGQESYFRSYIAGGYSYPFYIYSYAERMAAAVNQNYSMGEVSVTELFPQTYYQKLTTRHNMIYLKHFENICKNHTSPTPTEEKCS